MTRHPTADPPPAADRSPFQMLAYVTALDLPGGLLIYARAEAKVAKYKVRRSGKLLEVDALDLSGPLDCVLQRVRSLRKWFAYCAPPRNPKYGCPLTAA